MFLNWLFAQFLGRPTPGQQTEEREDQIAVWLGIAIIFVAGAAWGAVVTWLAMR